VRQEVALFSVFSSSVSFLKTWYVSTNPYTGVLAMRCMVGAKPREMYRTGFER